MKVAKTKMEAAGIKANYVRKICRLVSKANQPHAALAPPKARTMVLNLLFVKTRERLKLKPSWLNYDNIKPSGILKRGYVETHQ
jgi:hypothetical protein